MNNFDTFEALFIITAILFQLILIIHFAMRKWRFSLAMRLGWIVYALSIPASLVSVILLVSHQPWYFWIGGFLYLIWGGYGYWIEYIQEIQWRNPPRWHVLGPYLVLYFSTVMFYWWPLAKISKSFWYVYTVMFIISTILNVTSHQSKQHAFNTA